MPSKRNMPSISAIASHWCCNDKIDLYESEAKKICWACGFEKPLERCHLKAKIDGGTDTVENLVLLCKQCHAIQETQCMTDEGRDNFIDEIYDGAPYMTLQFKRLYEQYKNNLAKPTT